MPVRPMHGLVFSLLALCLAPAAAAQAPAGEWTGTGVQVNVDGRSQAWTVRIHSDADKSGKPATVRVDYPSLTCGGTLERLTGGDLWREHITYGACIDGGTVRMDTRNGLMVFSWFGDSAGLPEENAAAILYPVRPMS